MVWFTKSWRPTSPDFDGCKVYLAGPPAMVDMAMPCWNDAVCGAPTFTLTPLHGRRDGQSRLEDGSRTMTGVLGRLAAIVTGAGCGIGRVIAVRR